MILNPNLYKENDPYGPCCGNNENSDPKKCKNEELLDITGDCSRKIWTFQDLFETSPTH